MHLTASDWKQHVCYCHMQSKAVDCSHCCSQPPHTHPPLLHTHPHRLMTQAVEHLRHELAGVRTGRANPGLLENITVNIAGSSLPLKACGAVTVRNPQLLAVSVYSPEVRNKGVFVG